MTRCDAYWDKVRDLLAKGDKEGLVEFCEKSPRMIERIIDHVEYEEKHNLRPIGPFSEGTTRPLRTLERINPDLHTCALDLVLNEGMTPKDAVALVRKQAAITPPTGLYNIIVIDPPWKFDGDYDGAARRSVPQYPMMDYEEIQSLDIPAADDCVLWLWTTNLDMKAAWMIAEIWGFEVKSILTWVKNRMGLGYWLRGQTEHCLLCIKGSPIWNNTTMTTALHADVREHSRKPDEFYTMVDRICSGTKLDMFAREQREGWTTWGNETEKF